MIFINGNPAGSTTLSGLSNYNINTSSNAVYLGSNGSNYLSGMMDEVRIFNRVLTDVEISARYNALKPQ